VRVLLFETNLMWSAKLGQSLRGLGHEPVMVSGLPGPDEHADAAILNLAQTDPDPARLARALHELSIPVIAHAGHKEQAHLAIGRSLGVDVLATNSELTFKLEALLARLTEGRGST
jgi:hypothetical protein